MSAKPPVMMIHGGFCGPFVWDGFATKFARAGYAVHCPALRFHDMDKAPDALGSTSLSDYAADLEESLDALGRPAVLIGHGLGGLLAQMLAARKKVRALVLLAPSAPWGVPPSSLFEIAQAQALLLKPGFWNKVMPLDKDGFERHALCRLPAAERQTLLDRFMPESGRAIFESVHWGLDMSRASDVDAKQITAPLLLISGGEDRINPPGTVERIAALYGKRATCEIMPGMGHWLIGEPGWESVTDRALTWLASIQ